MKKLSWIMLIDDKGFQKLICRTVDNHSYIRFPLKGKIRMWKADELPDPLEPQGYVTFQYAGYISNTVSIYQQID